MAIEKHGARKCKNNFLARITHSKIGRPSNHGNGSAQAILNGRKFKPICIGVLINFGDQPDDDFVFMDKLRNDISNTLKLQEETTKQMMSLILDSSQIGLKQDNSDRANKTKTDLIAEKMGLELIVMMIYIWGKDY